MGLKRLLMAGMLVVHATSLNGEELQAVTTQMTPYQTLEDGQVAGINTLWVKRLLEKAELEAEFAIYPWARAVNIASTQPNVLIYAIARSKEREHDFHWIGRIAEFEQALIALSEQQTVIADKVAQQQRISLALPRGHAAKTYMESLSFHDLVDVLYTGTTDEAWQLLINQRVDTVIENPQLLSVILPSMQLDLTAVKVLETIPASRKDAYLAASKGTNTEVIERLRQAYQQLFPAEP